MKYHLVWIIVFLTYFAADRLEARTWTSSDGTKTFQGELRSFNASTGEVRVVINGKLITFQQSVLSKEDQEFLKNASKSASSGSNSAEVAEELKGQKVGKQVMDGRPHRIDGKRFKKAELTKAPEYYILYFSASW